MGRQATDQGGDFEDAPHGNHIGRCYKIVDLGTQHSEYQGKAKARNQVFVGFELDAPMSDGRPFTIAAFWTNSLGAKATLRTVLETWRNRKFTEEELAGFDLEKLLGVPGIVTVGIKPEGKKTTVLGVGPLMKGMTAPPQVNETFSFWIDEWNQAKFDSLPDGIKDIIKQSDEYKAKFVSRRTAQDDDIPPGRNTADFDDSIPF